MEKPGEKEHTAFSSANRRLDDNHLVAKRLADVVAVLTGPVAC